MKALGIIALLIVGYLVFKKYNILQTNPSGSTLPTSTAAGYIAGYGYMTGSGYQAVGPQGPNDGSNNPSGNGETLVPFDPIVIQQRAATRGFAYTGSTY